MKRVVTVAIAVFVAVAFAPLALVAMFGAPATAVAPVTCVITGPVGALSTGQSAVVEAIAGRAELVGDVQKATEIGIDVSLALTKLVNVPLSTSEVGPFAFDPHGNWGPSNVLGNMNEDVVIFMAALSVDATWATGSVPTVANSVMITNGVRVPASVAVFKKVLRKAEHLTKIVIALASSQNTCGTSDPSTLTGVGTGLLPASYQIPADATPPEAEAISAAISQIGNTYLWGGASTTTGFDCSGLTMWAWAQASPPFALDHYTVSQWEETQPLTSLTGASPGDIVLVPGSDGSLTPPNPQHVGMYIGDVNGVPWVVDAADEQLGVIAQTYSSFIAGGLIAVGHIVDGASS